MRSIDSEVRARPEWPLDILDVRGLIRNGWRPTPITHYVLKINSRCNLACSYCYIYEKGDESWRARPRRMSEDTLSAAVARIAEHTAEHSVERVNIVFHGGEPLLSGVEYIGSAVTRVRESLPSGTTLAATVQTNGVLLDEATLDGLLRHAVRVGVSVDGTPEAHDRQRRFADGRPSSTEVEAGIRRLAAPRYRAIYGGLLCVVDLAEDPIGVYKYLRSFGPPRMDFLLPHGDWHNRPPARADDGTHPYSDWLTRIFDHWYVSGPPRPGIRLFEEIIHLLLGGNSRTEAVGVSPAATLVIETDGAIEQVDSLRSAYPGAAATGLHILRDPVDAALLHAGVAARQIGVDALADECRRCLFARICGGGFYGHRYRAGHGFRNPSVYCPDLFALIDHIRTRIDVDLHARRRAR
ncbi:FxsB family cyclophane-forming radical SAM/SPASM peptide maturase [Cryptosporangium japonicum]|uniref:Radical SAM core domain-containing protein n=1 Tax=Cryptosporangium japonicum TaxID=80872 RepID=A0ABP3DDB8_9ACTN